MRQWNATQNRLMNRLTIGWFILLLFNGALYLESVENWVDSLQNNSQEVSWQQLDCSQLGPQISKTQAPGAFTNNSTLFVFSQNQDPHSIAALPLKQMNFGNLPKTSFDITKTKKFIRLQVYGYTGLSPPLS